MGYALLVWSGGATSTPSGAFATIGNATNVSASSTEAFSQLKTRIAGTLSNLQVNADAIGTARSVKSRKNTADGNLVVNPTDTTAGVYTDNTHSDSLASTDLFNVGFTSTGTPTYLDVRALFSATTNHACFYSAVTGSANTPTISTTYYFKPAGRSPTLSSSTVEANAKLKARVAGTWQNAQIYLQTNGCASDTHLKSRINGVDGTIDVTITASTTGLFEDSSHTDAIAAGDDWNFSLTFGASIGTWTAQRYSSAIGGIATAANDVFAGNTAVAVTRAASGTANFLWISGRLIASNTTEANAKIQHGFPVDTTRLRMYLSANTYSAAGTVVMRKNGADGTQTFALTASTTGLFEDTSHTDSFASTDDANISVVGGTSGSITMEWTGLMETDTTPGPTTNIGATLSMMGVG